MTLDRFTAAALDGLPHGFFGRRGGVSRGVAASLNCGLGSGDAPAAVARNRAIAAAAILPSVPLVGVYQIHSAECVAVAAAWADADRPRADALVTDRPDILLSILTADCAPVLFADREAGVIGAAHAGWRGAVGGVTDATIAAMIGLGARVDHIAAAVGPCIARASYEVDHGFFDRFIADDPANERFFGEGAGDRPHFDLEAYVCARIATAGVGRVAALGLDTYVDEVRFYSFRRATHRGEADYGRQISVIGLAP